MEKLIVVRGALGSLSGEEEETIEFKEGLNEEEQKESPSDHVKRAHAQIMSHMTKMERITRSEETTQVHVGKYITGPTDEIFKYIEEISHYFPTKAPFGKTGDLAEIKKQVHGIGRDVADIIKKIKGTVLSKKLKPANIDALDNLVLKSIGLIEKYFDLDVTDPEIRKLLPPKPKSNAAAFNDGAAELKAKLDSIIEKYAPKMKETFEKMKGTDKETKALEKISNFFMKKVGDIFKASRKHQQQVVDKVVEEVTGVSSQYMKDLELDGNRLLNLKEPQRREKISKLFTDFRTEKARNRNDMTENDFVNIIMDNFVDKKKGTFREAKATQKEKQEAAKEMIDPIIGDEPIEDYYNRFIDTLGVISRIPKPTEQMVRKILIDSNWLNRWEEVVKVLEYYDNYEGNFVHHDLSDTDPDIIKTALGDPEPNKDSSEVPLDDDSDLKTQSLDWMSEYSEDPEQLKMLRSFFDYLKKYETKSPKETNIDDIIGADPSTLTDDERLAISTIASPNEVSSLEEQIIREVMLILLLNENKSRIVGLKKLLSDELAIKISDALDKFNSEKGHNQETAVFLNKTVIDMVYKHKKQFLNAIDYKKPETTSKPGEETEKGKENQEELTSRAIVDTYEEMDTEDLEDEGFEDEFVDDVVQKLEPYFTQNQAQAINTDAVINEPKVQSMFQDLGEIFGENWASEEFEQELSLELDNISDEIYSEEYFIQQDIPTDEDGTLQWSEVSVDDVDFEEEDGGNKEVKYKVGDIFAYSETGDTAGTFSLVDGKKFKVTKVSKTSTGLAEYTLNSLDEPMSVEYIFNDYIEAGIFNKVEELEEQIQRKLETLIEHYLNTGKI